jgi:hypothetical protein
MSKNKTKGIETKDSSYATVIGPRKRHQVEVLFDDWAFEHLTKLCGLNRCTIGELCTVLLEEDCGRRTRQFDRIIALQVEVAVAK